MVSLTSEYALRAMVYLARQVDRWPIPGRAIAADTGIPHKYLLSILGAQVRAGVLHSSPGRGGGFSLARPACDIMLVEVLAPVEQSLGHTRSCPFGSGVCNEDDPCPAHGGWKRVREEYARFLEETSVQKAAFVTHDRPGASEV